MKQLNKFGAETIAMNYLGDDPDYYVKEREYVTDEEIVEVAELK